MEEKTLKRAVENRLGEMATHPKMQERATKLVDRKLGAMLYTAGEAREIAADAISDSVVKLLASLNEGTSKLLLDDASKPITEDILSHPLSKYLQFSVNNYCKTRLDRWSLDKNNHDPAGSGEKQPKESGVRSRYEINSEKTDDTDFWDQHIQQTDNHSSLDAPKVKGMLVQRGLKEQQISRILLYLGGMSFAEMARQQGGNEATYRHSVKTALNKADLQDLYTG
ncbi:hypothetical protein [Neptunomonas qingdaonensis]|uniref:Uncharacterized protein n=1 Tax=Neptunomonas qingdaonensis TaxID=1045558 RepID=A0A1I2QPJ9_9GAMM|nr:hypothetical protein [Neptunomonas qingdaonensis]SFG30264.1 hypothetical protein SAMN05216175_10567 [Neptunomonas qingdaonensis]